MAVRSEARNQTAREALQPLREDERPGVVTIGAAISGLLALSVLIGYAAGVEVSEFSNEGVELGTRRPPVAQVIVPAALLGVMAWGMWRARYWAVLGFQTVLLIVIVVMSLSLVAATRWEQAVGNVVVIAVAGTMFYFMIRALARIQMPERLPR